MAQGPAHFTIPFDFNVGRKSFAAGEYRVGEVGAQSLAISSADGRARMVVITYGASPGKVPGEASLTFQRYGDRYFLSRMSDYDHGWEVPKSADGKELIAERASSRRLDIIASSRK